MPAVAFRDGIYSQNAALTNYRVAERYELEVKTAKDKECFVAKAVLSDKAASGIYGRGAQHDFEINEGVSFVVTCDTQDEIDFYWLNITEGGTRSKLWLCRDTFGVGGSGSSVWEPYE
ncbi:hypothetical protein FQR65_LT19580 [Abscondita terminalis]|nr:hypothetical protein FQR65_LT19580 [Abscondita terminalis]